MTLPPNLSTIFRNAIDLNRYSNSVARRIINQYNDIIIDSVNQLQTLDEQTAPVKAARLRAILAQLKESLATWAGDSTEITALELQGLAELQSEFVEEQLRLALPAGARDMVRSVEISPQFAQSVVTTDPTQINMVALSDDLFLAVEGVDAAAGAPTTFSLTARQGATITLPNGQVVEKAFRGLAVSQAERFSQVVRQGLLTGEPTADIARRIRGSLEFGEEAKTVKQLALAGGELTKAANHQVVTLVRTSVNQVANEAAMRVYESNSDITKKYKYVATLDSRTSAICRALDGRVFEYGKGPKPPQHFNCLPGDALVTTSGRIAAVYRRRYEGFLYVIKTTNGHVVRVTPNHPVLTLTGWQPAQSINVGDQVFSCSLAPNKLVYDRQKCNAVTTAEDVFRAFGESSAVSTVEVPTSAPDFHGDASCVDRTVNFAEQVAVVLADRELLLAVNPGLLNALFDFGLQWPDFSATASSHLEQRGLAIGATALGIVGSSGKGFAISKGSATHTSELLFASVSELATRFQNDSLYGTWRDIELISDSANPDAVVVSGNDQVNVAWVGREPFSGHVYNFETEGGTYWANGILTHNCRSTIVSEIDYEGLGFEPPRPGKRAARGGMVDADINYGQWLLDQGAARQKEVLGSKAPYFRLLARKHGARNAMAKLVREDGSELTLAQLRSRYGAVKER